MFARTLLAPFSLGVAKQRLTVAGLFAGIAGFEEGFRQAGHATALFCESDPAAGRVLAQRFPRTGLLPES